MTKKSTIKLPNGVIIELDSQYDFKKKYVAWVQKCEGISKEAIMSVGKKNSPKPANLYLQLKEHVTDNFVRPNSTNKGKNRGAYRLLEEIDKSMTKKTLYSDKDIKEIKSFIRKIKRYNVAGSPINPSNILIIYKQENRDKDVYLTEKCANEAVKYYQEKISPFLNNLKK